MARKKKVVLPKVPFQVEVDSEEIIYKLLHNLSFDQIHEFIVKLERSCQDWGVTERLYNYFAEEMEKLQCDDEIRRTDISSQ
jgi:hypothetical protein